MKYTYFISCEFEIERQYWQDFSKIQPLFAVIDIQICLNGREWLRRMLEWLRRMLEWEGIDFFVHGNT